MTDIIDQRMADLIHRSTGLTVEQIRNTPLEEVHAAIEKKIGHKLELGLEPGKYSSGNMLIDMGRTISSEEIQKEIDKI